MADREPVLTPLPVVHLGVELLQCSECGSVVTDAGQHLAWHAALKGTGRGR